MFSNSSTSSNFLKVTIGNNIDVSQISKAYVALGNQLSFYNSQLYKIHKLNANTTQGSAIWISTQFVI
jgi:hypothetical protein